MYPRAGLDNLRVEEVIGVATDLMDKFNLYYAEKEPKEKEAIMKDIVDNEIPFWAEKLDKLIEQNGPHGYFVGESLTVADVYAYTVFEGICCNMSGYTKGIPDNCLDKYKNISKMRENVRNHPAVKKWEEDHKK